LTYNTFLFGFPQEYCTEGHEANTTRAYHYYSSNEEKKFICESCLKTKYNEKKNEKGMYRDIYERTKHVSQTFKEVGYAIRAYGEIST